MADRVTAEDRLHRLLWLLPVAAQPGGASLAALAAELGVEPRALLRDIDEATTRAFHHPAGAVEPFTILIEAGDDRDATIEVHTTGEFQRPTRLAPREALAVALGLRAMAAQVITDPDPALGLACRIEDELSVPDVREMTPPAAATRPIAAEPPADEGDIEATVMDATQRTRRCRIRYIKPGEPPRERVVEPYRLVYASTWYLLARDVAQDGIRCFRLDRIAAASVIEDAAFDVPADFDPANHLSDGLPVPTEGEDVLVHYSAPASRWVAEATGSVPDGDGSVRVTRRVVDRRWLVRHILAFGGAAEVLAPHAARAEIAAAARAIVQPHTGIDEPPATPTR